MGHVQHNVEQLVIPVAGAFNCGPTAKIHLEPLLSRLQAGPERIVVDPLVPSHFGLYRLDQVQDKFADKVHELADQHPNARLVIVGHSLGGLLGRSQDAQGLITIGTPHEGTKWYVPGYFRRQYEAFSQQPTAEHIGSVAMIGSRIDEMVPLGSSLASSRTEIDGQRITTRPILLHNWLPVAPSITALTSRLVDQMFESQTPSIADMAVSA